MRTQSRKPLGRTAYASLTSPPTPADDRPRLSPGPGYPRLRCSTTRPRSGSRAGAAATGSSRSDARRTCHGAAPTAATVGVGATSCVVCDASRRDLASLRFSPHFRAGRGRHGEGARRHGARGDDEVILVPPGTTVEGLEGERFDLVEPGQRSVVASGGAGGHGNKRFASSTRQAPRFAESGLDGEFRLDRAPPAPAGGRRARRAAERRQVLAPGTPHAGRPEGRRLPVHDDRPGARDAGGRRSPARARRRPGADRGRRRRRRARRRVPRPCRALPRPGSPGGDRPAGGRPRTAAGVRDRARGACVVRRGARHAARARGAVEARPPARRRGGGAHPGGEGLGGGGRGGRPRRFVGNRRGLGRTALGALEGDFGAHRRSGSDPIWGV